MGMSLGGFLAPRAASGEHRLAALIAYDGMYSWAEGIERSVGPRSCNLLLMVTTQRRTPSLRKWVTPTHSSGASSCGACGPTEHPVPLP